MQELQEKYRVWDPLRRDFHDRVPEFGSEDFLKMFSLQINGENAAEEYRVRVLGAAANGYGG